MGKLTAGGVEAAKRLVSGAFTAVGTSGPGVDFEGNAHPAEFTGLFNIQLSGTFVGQVQLENSFDGGSTWNAVSLDAVGTKAIYTAPVNTGVMEPEVGVLYRWNCTNYTSGTINYRISQ